MRAIDLSNRDCACKLANLWTRSVCSLSQENVDEHRFNAYLDDQDDKRGFSQAELLAADVDIIHSSSNFQFYRVANVAQCHQGRRAATTQQRKGLC